MFCASLRKRPSFASILPQLSKDPTLKLRENNLITHDIAIPVQPVDNSKPTQISKTRQIRFLLLSPRSVNDAHLHETLSRIQRFASLTGGQDIAIILLLSPPKDMVFTSAKTLIPLQQQTATDTNDDDGMFAYAKLQTELMNHVEIPSIPILPLATCEELPATLKKHMANVTRVLPKKPAAKSDPFGLLRLCTANEPSLAQQNVYVVSDVFSSLRELAETSAAVSSRPSSSPSAQGMSELNSEFDASSSSKLKRLRELVGDESCQGVMDFWKEEYTVD